eukprot:2931783-Amphidinium_carterae.1
MVRMILMFAELILTFDPTMGAQVMSADCSVRIELVTDKGNTVVLKPKTALLQGPNADTSNKKTPNTHTKLQTT